MGEKEIDDSSVDGAQATGCCPGTLPAELRSRMVATSSPVGKEGREGERETKRNENKYEYKAAFKVFYEFFFFL